MNAYDQYGFHKQKYKRMNTINKKLKAIFFALLLGLAFYSCSSNGNSSVSQESTDEHAGHNYEAEPEGEHNEALHEIKETLAENEVVITEKQMDAVGIQLDEIKKQALSGIVKSFGELVLAPSDEATVSALIGGIVNNIKVMDGDFVRKGDIIARIVHPEIVNMQQDYLEARSKDEYLKAEYMRQKLLLDDSINAQKTVQNARAEYQANLVKMQSLKKKLQLIQIDAENLTPENIRNNYPLIAPISGYVANVDVNTGSHVSPQQSLFHITDIEKTHIDLKVYEKDINKVKTGQRITFKLANNITAKSMDGEIMKMGKRFDPEQRTAIVHASIDGMNVSLLPGMSVIAYIQTGEKIQVTLPETAFVSDGGKDYVFLLKREIELEEIHTVHESENEVHSEAEVHEDQHETEYDIHGEADYDSGKHFYVFEIIQIEKGITQAGFSGFLAEIEDINASRFATSNAQALLSEMKKGSGSGHSGHAH